MSKLAWLFFILGLISAGITFFSWKSASLDLLLSSTFLMILFFAIFVFMNLWTVTKRGMDEKYKEEYNRERKRLNQRQTIISSFTFWHSRSGGSSEPEPQHGDAPEGMLNKK